MALINCEVISEPKIFVPEFPKDLQQYILLQLDDNNLAKTFRTCTDAAIFYDNDEFWRLRILFVYNSDLSKYKGKGKTYKEIYIDLRKYEKKSIEELLFRSAELGYLPVVIYLVEKGANIHAYDDKALRWAADNGHSPLVTYLVEQGADIHAVADYAIRWAAKNGHLLVVIYLVKKGANIHSNYVDALRSAAKYGHLPVVTYLVENGAHIHAVADYALRWAAGNGHLPVVIYLVEKGATVNSHAKDDVLRLAEKHGKKNVVIYLKQQLNSIS